MRRSRWNNYRYNDESRVCPVCGNVLEDNDKFYVTASNDGNKIIGCHECVHKSEPDVSEECPVCDESFTGDTKNDFVYHNQQGQTVGCMWCVFEEYPENTEVYHEAV